MKERGNFVLLFCICLSLSIHPHFLEELGGGTIKRKDIQHGQQPLRCRSCSNVNSNSLVSCYGPGLARAVTLLNIHMCLA